MLIKREFEDETKARTGLVECVKKGVVNPCDVLYEQSGALIARFMFTVLLLPAGPLRITNILYDEEEFLGEKQIKNEELKKILAEPVRNSKKEKKLIEKTKK